MRNREQLHLRGRQGGPVEGYNNIHHPQPFFLQCGESCQPTSTACHGSCPHGHILMMGNECALQESLCLEEQCVHDSDCQENAGCLLSGTVPTISHYHENILFQVMACQCYLNFVASNATAAPCPRTGVCTHALDIAQVTFLDVGSIFCHFIFRKES